jgi:sn1-specific diacylglycerol lipase
VLFNWALFGLAIFGLALIFDPLGSKRYHEVQETPGGGESLRHKKVTSLWHRRFRWAFCWMRSDEHGNEAFRQVAAILSDLFRSTDLVPSDILAGCILLRVKQKKETREMRRIRMLTDDDPKYTSGMLTRLIIVVVMYFDWIYSVCPDINKIFAVAPRWMNLENARHFLRLSIATYGWPFVMYRHCMTGFCRLLGEATCCACFRSKSNIVTDDNCCFCHLAGVKYMSKIREEDILFASFRNHVFEVYLILLLYSFPIY